MGGTAWQARRLESSKLWKGTLAEKGGEDSDKDARARIRTAFDGMRRKAEDISNDIARSWPSGTDHSIVHLDALWEIADDLVAPDEMTPLGAFLLGAAFLTHDLANGAAAYPGGEAVLRDDPRWRDHLWRTLSQRLGRAPSEAELAAPHAEDLVQVNQALLRLRHAEQASRLPADRWTIDGRSYHLIEDDEIRHDLSEIIGQIARSHGESVLSAVEALRSSVRSPPAWLPRAWTYEPLRLAAVLRVADAAQIDQRRAPGFLGALRRPQGESKLHWEFQRRMCGPRVEQGLLVFDASPAFGPEDTDAWWLAFETLQMIDREIRQSNAMLADKGQHPLPVRGVRGAEDANHMAQLIPVQGWRPIDVRIRSTDVIGLAERLGGRWLYNNDQRTPLRELIQNASDAVRARRYSCSDEDWRGRVTVRLGRDDAGHWIEVEDNGVGMSEVVLTGPLLDFGTTYWTSSTAVEEHPGLLSSGFRATGRFGIGFFSIFMWGHRVRVTTLPYRQGSGQTQVLEIPKGLRSRPVLRQAQPGERRTAGGSVVRVWLQDDPRGRNGLLDRGGEAWSLAELCAWIAPALDADVYVSEDGAPVRRVVEADDWKTMDAGALLARLSPSRSGAKSGEKQVTVSELARNVTGLRNEDGTLVGRAALVSPRVDTRFAGHSLHAGALVIGGLQARPLQAIAGLLLTEPDGPTRRRGTPLVSPAVLRAWAGEQRTGILRYYGNDVGSIADCTVSVHACGADTAELPVALYEGRALTIAELAALVEDWPRAWIAGGSPLRARAPNLLLQPGSYGKTNWLNSGYGWEGANYNRFYACYPRVRTLGPEFEGLYRSDSQELANHLEPLVVETIARSWGTTVGALVAAGLARHDSVLVGEPDDPAHGVLVLERPERSTSLG